MMVELVRTKTRDGMPLDGALVRPERSVEPAAAVLCLHGVGGNFYSSRLFDALQPVLLERGLAVLRVNTRGHDGLHVAATDDGPRRQGAAFEVVDECRLDLAAWCDWLTTRHVQQIVLAGHSLGAIKALYSEAHQPHPRVAALLAMSPPRLSSAAFRHDPRSGDYFEALQLARQAVDGGQPRRLLEVRFPFPLIISAEGYLDNYGPQERYNVLRFVNRVQPPVLFTYGERELETGGTAFAGVPAALASLADEGQSFEFATITAADHFYTDAYDGLSEALLGFLDRRLPPR